MPARWNSSCSAGFMEQMLREVRMRIYVVSRVVGFQNGTHFPQVLIAKAETNKSFKEVTHKKFPREQGARPPVRLLAPVFLPAPCLGGVYSI